MFRAIHPMVIGEYRLIVMFQVFTVVLLVLLKLDTNWHINRLSKMIDAIISP